MSLSCLDFTQTQFPNFDCYSTLVLVIWNPFGRAPHHSSNEKKRISVSTSFHPSSLQRRTLEKTPALIIKGPDLLYIWKYRTIIFVLVWLRINEPNWNTRAGIQNSLLFWCRKSGHVSVGPQVLFPTGLTLHWVTDSSVLLVSLMPV